MDCIAPRSSAPPLVEVPFSPEPPRATSQGGGAAGAAAAPPSPPQAASSPRAAGTPGGAAAEARREASPQRAGQDELPPSFARATAANVQARERAGGAKPPKGRVYRT